MQIEAGSGDDAGRSKNGARATPAAVEIKDASKVFGKGTDAVRALDTVSLTIRQNEFFTLLGPSGCGKTTLLRLIAGFDHPTTGLILLEGADISALPPYKRPVNTVFQNYALFPHLTVSQNIAFGMQMLGKSKSETADTVAEMLRLVRMEELANRRTSQISGGQQQRVALARALAPRPRLLLLDEPLSALDYKLRKDMQIELKRLQHETGITFIFVTHDQEEALTMSDRLAVMNQGNILQVGTPRQIYDHPAERFVANFIGESNFVGADLKSVDDGVGTVALPWGAQLTATLPDPAMQPGKVSVVIRPEHAHLTTDPGRATARGTCNNVVYFGTDTHYHLTLTSGEPFTVRQQNTPDGSQAVKAGDEVGIIVDQNAIQVLRD